MMLDSHKVKHLLALQTSIKPVLDMLVHDYQDIRRYLPILFFGLFFRLKLGNDFQYVLSAEGSSPSKVLGIDYKTTVKPALNSLAEDMKKSSLLKLEELIALQQQTEQNTKILEEKKDQLAGLQSKIEEVHHILYLEYFKV